DAVNSIDRTIAMEARSSRGIQVTSQFQYMDRSYQRAQNVGEVFQAFGNRVMDNPFNVFDDATSLALGQYETVRRAGIVMNQEVQRHARLDAQQSAIDQRRIQELNAMQAAGQMTRGQQQDLERAQERERSRAAGERQFISRDYGDRVIEDA